MIMLRNVYLVGANIIDFYEDNYNFHVIYSVLTFMHIEDKEKTFNNIKRYRKQLCNYY